MAVTEARNGTARRSRYVPLCAILALLIGAAACLNPIPDDFPNQRDDSAPVYGPGEPPSTSRPPGQAVDDDVDGEDNASPESPVDPSQGAPHPDEAELGDAGAARAAARRSDAGHEALDAGVPSGDEP